MTSRHWMKNFPTVIWMVPAGRKHAQARSPSRCILSERGMRWFWLILRLVAAQFPTTSAHHSRTTWQAALLGNARPLQVKLGSSCLACSMMSDGAWSPCSSGPPSSRRTSWGPLANFSVLAVCPRLLPVTLLLCRRHLSCSSSPRKRIFVLSRCWVRKTPSRQIYGSSVGSGYELRVSTRCPFERPIIPTCLCLSWLLNSQVLRSEGSSTPSGASSQSLNHAALQLMCGISSQFALHETLVRFQKRLGAGSPSESRPCSTVSSSPLISRRAVSYDRPV